MRSFVIGLSFLLTTSTVALAQDATGAGQMQPAPLPQSSEANMKVLAGSGGKVTQSVITDAPLMSDFVMGKDTAPLVVIEYASLSCPHCAHFSNSVLPELEKRYIETGKIRYILRQFPLNEAALKGAMLLDCVGAQDEKKYYTFSRVLFDAQSKWAFDANYMSGLETIASVGGLTKDQFMNCMNNTDRETRILRAKKDTMDNLKIPHTPYIYVGDEIYEGDRTIEQLSAFIDAKLAEKGNRSWLPKW
jgi:protein-disulfide isomerase